MMLKSLPKFLLAAFTFFVCQKLNAQTEAEPNNTAATANTLALGGADKGKINPAGDVDWYKVTTNADGQLSLSISNNSAYVSIYFYDKDGVTRLNSADYINSAGGTINTDGLAAGTYYAKVYCTNAGDTSSYTVSNALTTTGIANDAEPDSTRGQALTLPVNNSKTGHVGYYYNNHRDSVDWYKVTTTADGQLTLYLNDNSHYVSLYLYDNDGTTLLNHADYINSSGGSINTDGLAAGTYYIKVYCTNITSEFSAYTLKDSLFTLAQANDVEPDSTRGQAINLPVNSSKTGHVGYYYNNHRDSVDWYKVTTNSDGQLNLYLNNNSHYVSLYLYDNDGITPINHADYINSGGGSVITDGLAAGTYYVKVYCTNINSDFSAYTLKDSLFVPAQANDNEPDSNRATALTLPTNTTTTGHVGYYYNNHRDSTDWYKVTLKADGQLNLYLNDNRAYISVYLYDNDGVTRINYADYINSGGGVISTDGLAAGTYYVKVFCTNINSDFSAYTLKDSLFTYKFAADTAAEPNGSPHLAKTLLVNRVTTGHTGFYYNLVKDTSDWWKINYTGTGALQITLNFEPNIHSNSMTYFSYRLYSDTNAAAISSADYINSPSYTINLGSLPQQYYYIKLYNTNTNSEFESYSIADSFIQVNKALISINSSKTTINSSTCGADSITYNLSGSHSPYTVRFYKNGALYDSVKTISATTTFKGLPAGNYYATVYGDGATDSAYSKSVTSTATPPVPTALTTSGIGVHTATLNWTKLSCVNYYKVQYRAVGSPTWIVVNTTGDTSKLALTGLSPYTLYAWEVASVDTTKGLTFTSAFADSITFRTLSDTAHIALTFKGAGSGCNNDTLRYTSTNSAAPYTVTLYRNGVAYGSPLSVTSVASFYNVPPGNYYAKSTGTGSGGSFGISATTQILPPAPTGLDTTMITPTAATLSWDPVSCSNYYTVQYKVTGTTTWTTVFASANTSALTGLTPDTKYTWRVSASDSFNNQTVTSAYSDTATFKTSSILPVTFVSFSAVLNNGNALLSWSTSNEINNKGFQVERSNDGAHFNSIGFVNAQYGHSILNYVFTDNNIISGFDYYRLKQIDVDGNFMYSKIIKLDLSKFAWSVNGNPVINNNSNIQLKLDHTATVSVQIISLNGSVLQTIHKGSINAGNYTIPLTMNNVSAGMYIVKLMVDKQYYTTTIMKQ